MKLVRLAVLSLTLLFYGCELKEQPNLTFVKAKEIIFNVGYVANQRYVGIWKDKESNQDLIFFGDPKTYKCIKIFSLNGQLRDVVPLNSALDKVNDIDNFNIISLDTIVVFGEHNNKIVFMDHTGSIWKNININELVSDSLNVPVEYITSYKREFMFNKQLFLKVSYAPHKNGIKINSFKDFFKVSLDVPLILKINNILSPFPKSKFGLNSFYRRFMSDSSAMGELANYALAGPNLVFQSRYSDTIYIADTSNLNIIKTFEVKSDYTRIGFLPFPSTINRNQYEEIDKEASNSGSIYKVIFDPIHEIYIISIFWENKKVEPREKWNYSFLIYNKKGEKIKEIVWNTDYYVAACAFLSEGKLYISSNSTFRSDFDKKTDRYEEFELVE